MDTYDLQIKSAEGQLSVLQLTDPHLFAEESGTLLGVHTAQSFKAVLESILNQNLHFDCVIVSGDISQDYSVSSYQRFAHAVSVLERPVFFVPGNHDDGPLMYRILSDYGVNTQRCLIADKWQFVFLNVSVLERPVFFVPGNHDDGPLMYRILSDYGVNTQRCLIADKWQFVFLNSEVYSVPHGWLERHELNYLRDRIEERPDLNTVVVVHHLPRHVNSRWLDTQTMHNQDEFNSFICNFPQVKLVLSGHVHQEYDQIFNNIRYIASPSTSIQFEPYSHDFALDLKGPQVKLVLSGHVHQEYDQIFNNIRYIASPSTSIQFEPYSHDFALDLKGPGWRYLQFDRSGNINTQVFRLPEGRFIPDTSFTGY